MLLTVDGDMVEGGFTFCTLDFEKENVSSGHQWLQRNIWYGSVKPVEALVSPVSSLQDSILPDFCSGPCSTFCILPGLVKAFKKLSPPMRMAPVHMSFPCPLSKASPFRGKKYLSFRRTATPAVSSAVTFSRRGLQITKPRRNWRCNQGLCWVTEGDTGAHRPHATGTKAEY